MAERSPLQRPPAADAKTISDRDDRLSAVRELFWLFPGVCVLCGRRSGRAMDLCRFCESDFTINEPACPRCAQPMSVADTCGACIAAPPPFLRTIAPFAYAAPLSHLIPGLKSGNGLLEARVLAGLAAPRIERAYAGEALPDILMPVPLSYRRRVARGYNQAALVARCFGRHLGVEVDYAHLKRSRHGPSQHTLSAARRRALSRTAFRVTRTLSGQRIAVVDDVMTTGATVRAIASVLLAAGAGEVHVWVTARTGPATLATT